MVKKAQSSSITLHYLLASLSLWGTTARSLLFSFVAFMVLLISLTESVTATAFDNQLLVFIYVIGCFFLLDLGYVLVARAYQLRHRLDWLVLVTAEVILGLLYIVPKIVVSPRVSLQVDPLVYALFIPLLVIAMRVLVGILFGKKA